MKGWVNQYKPGCSLSTVEDAYLVAQWIPGDEIEQYTGIRAAVMAAQHNKQIKAQQKTLKANHEKKREAQAKRKATIAANKKAKAEKAKEQTEAKEAAKTQEDKDREAAERAQEERYRQGDELESTFEYINGEIELMVGINLAECMLRPNNNVTKLFSDATRMLLDFELKIVDHFLERQKNERKKVVKS